MTSYLGKHADFYDIFYGDKPYVDEAGFVENCLKKYSDGSSERLLELACGTGTHALELEKFGHSIVATDYSEDMLRRAQAKAEQQKSQVQFHLQDMTQLDRPEAPFDAAFCLFDAIGYVGSNEALDRVFRGVHKHVRSGGLFIFEFWHAAAMIRNYDPLRVRRWQTEQGEILRISETKLELAKQLSHISYTVYELNKDRTYSSLTETQTNRYFLEQEMAHWLTTSGFTPVKWFAGFTEDECITDDTWHVVAVARRV
jgi:ubiquinone/menaquinone biosynthesis C-methylase UbiE